MTRSNNARPIVLKCFIFLWSAVLVTWMSIPAYAAEGMGQEKDAFFMEWGGHLRLRGSVLFPENDSILDLSNHDRLHDGAFEFRLKNTIGFSDRVRLDAHYEMIGYGGETRKTQQAFFKLNPDAKDLFPLSETISDDRRVMDLTRIISSDTDYILYHRMDRLVLSVMRDWGTVRIGRQAITWGNGFLFNPMDLFNPFSPTDVERDYKIGDDMISARVYTGGSGELQVLYVPRRNTSNHHIKWDESSLAAKFHFNAGTTEIDMMAGHHYSDEVLGIGFTGYLMDAAWRLDSTYTWLEDGKNQPGFVSIVANIDYSWVWWDKNLYGWIEYYYTDLGKSEYQDALSDPDIMERISRGERFFYGRSYFNTQLQMEFHPLVNGFVSFIVNADDPSCIIQPRIVLDPAQNFQIMCGGNIYCGKNNTEFGGGEIPELGIKAIPVDMVYVWFSYYF